MGRKVFAAVVCWITLSNFRADAKKTTIKLEDSLGQETVSQLYRNFPLGVYASASPYAAFSFHVPTFAASPKLTQYAPIKQESVIVENTHGFLKDSYGNKFIESPQTLSYKSPFPQQYVQLQELPAHLAQPLVSAAPSFHYKQVNTPFFGSPQFKVQALQSALPATSARYAINQPNAFTGSVRALSAGQLQQHPTNNQAVYANSQAVEQFQNLKNFVKSQRLEEAPNVHVGNGPAPHISQSDRVQTKNTATAATSNKGKKAAINIETNPPVPLLDLSLLEPLTFDNPLVPQVQHFLPRINSVTYRKLPQPNLNEIKKEMKQFVIQKTKSYDSGIVKGNPKNNKHKKTQKKPHSESEEAYHEQVPLPPTRTPEDVSNEQPEISYEINSPNYKETYKEKVVSYNKETQSEPVHYNYEKKSEKEPIHYNYVHTSKEPIQVKNVHYESNGENPKHVTYTFKSNENNDDNNNHPPQRNESEETAEREVSSHQRKHNQGQVYDKETTYHHHERPEHREEERHHNPGKNTQHNIQSNIPQEYEHVQNIPVKNSDAHFRPIITEYEENIRILPTPKHYDTIKVDPNQHIQQSPVLLDHNSREHHNLQQNSPHNSNPETHQRPQYHPNQQVHEKFKRVIIKEETPEDEPSNDQANEEEVEQEEKNEEDFEKGYKNAAFGFPAYESSFRDTEKDIYNPDTYGRSQYQTEYDVEHTPFQQYQLEGDEFPKTSRLTYKDARDKTKEKYYLDYAVSKPESIVARYKQMDDYYKMFLKRKPQYLGNERESDKKNQKLFAKYTAPVFEYQGPVEKPKQYFANYKAAHLPQVFEYDYSKEAPKDNSAHATRPYHRLKTHTQFVEPQFQYGFEPSALPRLLDSELAAMASNDSPESEKPGSRKKIYKENWYIKKTSTNGRKTAS